MESIILALDKDLFVFINQDLSNAFLNILCPIIRKKETWIPLYVLVAFFAYKKLGKQSLVWLGIALITILFTDQTAHLFKILFERTRPCNEATLLPSLILRVDHCNNSYSFFSAHAANHFGQAFLYHSIFRNRWTSIGFFFWAATISFSQVYVGVHYPSDIFFGAIAGLGIGFICTKLEKLFSTYFTK